MVPPIRNPILATEIHHLVHHFDNVIEQVSVKVPGVSAVFPNNQVQEEIESGFFLK